MPVTNVRALSGYFSTILSLCCVLVTGCSQYIDPNVPEPIRPYVEPEFGHEYLLYRPSAYNNDHAWPLVMVCHSSFPDSPNKRIRAWTRLAEQHGFLVAAPTLSGNRASWPPKAPKQIPLQRDDEKRILAVIRNIRAAHNVSNDRIFIHGWSGGAYAALHTGLRHPEIFRVITMSQPKFDESYLTDVDDAIDHYQPVLVHYDVADAITGKHARRCVNWLRSRSANLSEDSHGAVTAGQAGRPVEFFEEILRRVPWIRIRAFPAPGGDPMKIQFKLHCSYQPTTYHWKFGDGDESTTPEPVHVYASQGTYPVAVTIDGPDGTQQQRSVHLKIPEVALGGANLAADAPTQ